ncbi:MAG: hypothetical protein M3P49_11595 [Actinomycetota bacterium]|nr:hypothetical protein [Actinomycetota bacterium]
MVLTQNPGALAAPQPPTSCFVVGPIGDKLAPFGSEERTRYEQAMQVWDYVIEPACQKFSINPVRADQITESGEITEQVCERLRDDDLVIADVTGGNPNVMYELGLRHTKNRLTIQLGERGRLPFDISTIRSIQFRRSETGLVEARDSLEAAIRTGLERGPRPVTATRIFSGAEVPGDTEPSGEEHEEEPGFLDMLAEAEDAAPIFARVAEELTALFEGIPALTDDAMTEMSKSDARGGGAGGRLRVAQNLAGRLEEPANTLEQLAADFVGELGRMSPGITYYVGLIEQNPSLLHEDGGAREFADAIREMARAAGGSLSQVDTLADVVQTLGQISTRLRPVSRRMSSALRRIAGTSRTIEEWGRRLDELEPDEDE